ncbi:MAG TPA: hypothetical protein VLA24_09225 [Pseudomonadales bacterium]|nr:hypothetical protein [Pseudomonadales bacterium]
MLDKDELLRRILEQLHKELLALINAGDNFQLTINAAPERGAVKIESKRTYDLKN